MYSIFKVVITFDLLASGSENAFSFGTLYSVHFRKECLNDRFNKADSSGLTLFNSNMH